MLTEMPRRPRPQTANTLLSRVSAFLPQALIPKSMRGRDGVGRAARRGDTAVSTEPSTAFGGMDVSKLCPLPFTAYIGQAEISH